MLFRSVPDFSGYGDEGRSLDDYPAALAQIEPVWSTPQAPDVIEALVFRDQWNVSREVFDVAAFRDLLLLHGVALRAATLPDAMFVPAPTAVSRFIPASRAGAGGAVAASTASSAGAFVEVPKDLPLPEIDGAAELDIDLSGDTPGHSAQQAEGGPERASDLANLIDFDLLASSPGAVGGSDK